MTTTGEYEMSDFVRLDKTHLISKDKKYKMWNDHSFFYPCGLFYDNCLEEDNFYYSMGHISYDYTFSYEDCLKVLNRILAGTWEWGKGTYLNKINLP